MHLCARDAASINQGLPTKRSCWRGEYKPGSTPSRSCWRSEYKPGSTPSHSCWRSEYKPGSTHKALILKAHLFTWSVKSDSCYNVLRLCSARCMKRTLWSSLDHALAQVRPRQIFTRTFSKNGRSLEPCTCFVHAEIWMFEWIGWMNDSMNL